MSAKKAIMAYGATLERIGTHIYNNKEKVEFISTTFGKGFIRGVLLTVVTDRKMYRLPEFKVGFKFTDVEDLIGKGLIAQFPGLKKDVSDYDPMKQFVVMVHIPAIAWCKTIVYPMDTPFTPEQVERNRASKDAHIGPDIIKQTEELQQNVPYQICRACDKKLDKKECVPLRCSRCKLAYYCNKDCQSADWKARHKKDCDEMIDLQSEFAESMCLGPREFLEKESAQSEIFNRLQEMNDGKEESQ